MRDELFSVALGETLVNGSSEIEEAVIKLYASLFPDDKVPLEWRRFRLKSEEVSAELGSLQHLIVANAHKYSPQTVKTVLDEYNALLDRASELGYRHLPCRLYMEGSSIEYDVPFRRND